MWKTPLQLGSLPPNLLWLILKIFPVKTPNLLRVLSLLLFYNAHPSPSKPSVKQSPLSFVQQSWEINCR